MNNKNSIQIIQDFKGSTLKLKLDELKNSILNGQPYPDLSEIYNSALKIKSISAQIDEIVHATGIIQCLPKILQEGEKVTGLSLASGADGEGFDLVTDKRIAEFKFARWQKGKGNGMRKRQVFADLVNLYLNNTTKSKELYVFNAEDIKKFFESKKTKCKNMLSKSLDNTLEQHLKSNKLSGEFLNDVYSISNVTIYDLDDILK